MPPAKRPRGGGHGQAKRMKTGQANGPAPKFQLREEITPPLTQPNRFPYFADGDVLIILDPKTPQYQYRLHSDKLRNASPVLCELLSQCVDKGISKTLHATNKTNISFYLWFNPELVVGWDLQRESLFHKVTPDNSNEILTTQGQMVDRGLSASYDGSTETAPTSPTDRGLVPSPELAPFADTKGENAHCGISGNASLATFGVPETPSSIEDSAWSLAHNSDAAVSPNWLLEQYSGNCVLSQPDDNQVQQNSQSDMIHSDIKTVPEDITTTATANSWSIQEELLLETGTPETLTSGSEFSTVEMRQCTVAEQISGDPSAAGEVVPEEWPSESIMSSRTPAHDKELVRNQISVMEHSTTSKGEKEKLCTSPESNIVQALNCTPTLQESNSGTRTSDGVDNTSSVKVNTEPASVKEAQDDECQIVSSRSKTPSPLASPITHIAKRRQVQDPAIIALDSMFRIIYNKAPIDSQLDMKLVLSQIENLISAAEYYELLPAVRASIGYSLAQRGRFLFREIFFRPIQWLNVSVELENKIIFQEAVVHLVGKFPDVDHFPRQFSGTSKGVRDLVYRKVVDMDRAISKVNESLMTSAIYESEIRVQLNGLNKYSFDVSILVHCWREWFIRRLMEARSPSVRPEEPNVQSKLAMLYRDIAAGGDTYLPEGEVMDSLRPFQLQGADQTDGFLQWDTAADDLALIKDYASRTVREICTNRSQLNHADGYFKYLTCTDVGDYELPWVSAPRN